MTLCFSIILCQNQIQKDHTWKLKVFISDTNQPTNQPTNQLTNQTANIPWSV